MASSDGWEDVPLSEDGWEDVPLASAKEQVHPLKSALAGGIQGASFGFMDEIAGAKGAGELAALRLAMKPSSLLRPGGVLKQALADYRSGRDGARGIMKEHEDANPRAFLAGELAGAVLTPVPGGTAAKGLGLGGRLVRAAGQGARAGAAYGLGSSEADLTEGEVGAAALDTTIGAGAGAVGGALGEGAASGGRRLVEALRRRAGRGIAEAVEAQAQKELGLAEKAIASQQGAYRSAVQSASRDLEVMAREAAELPPGPLKDRLTQMLTSPEGLAVREQVAGSKLATAPERIGEMQDKLAQLQSLVAGKEANVALQTANALQDPFRRHIAPRVWTLGHRMLPLAGGYIGNEIGGTEGALVGGTIGGIMSMTQGAPGRIVKNLIQSPAVRKAAWEKVLSATGGTAPEQLAIVRALRRASEGGARGLGPATAAAVESQAPGRALLRLVADGDEGEDEQRNAEDARTKGEAQARALRRQTR